MKKGTPLFDRHSRKKKEKPPEAIGKEDPEAKLNWITFQYKALANKPIKSPAELAWMSWAEDRITLLRIACA